MLGRSSHLVSLQPSNVDMITDVLNNEGEVGITRIHLSHENADNCQVVGKPTRR